MRQSYACAKKEQRGEHSGACAVIHTGNKRGKLSFAEARYFNPDELARPSCVTRTRALELAIEDAR